MVMKQAAIFATVVTLVLAAASASTQAQSQASAGAPGTLVQTIDLRSFTGAPTVIAAVPAPPPPASFALTSIAYDPSVNRLYAADSASTNVYHVDTLSSQVVAAVYTTGIGPITADIGPAQNLPGTAPTTVLVNPVTGRWLYTSQGGGAQFAGTTLAEPTSARAYFNGGAWDPSTDNVYGADGIEFFAVNNLKFLWAGFPCAGGSNAVAASPVTSRVYVSCGNSQTGGTLVMFDGTAMTLSGGKVLTPPLARLALGAQAGGLGINPATDRLYAAGMTSPTSLDVFDAATLQLLGSISGLEASSPALLPPGMPAPRQVVVNSVTNTIFVVNPQSGSVAAFDGASNTFAGTLTTGDAVSAAVNERANLLYVANAGGTISVFDTTPSLPAPVPAPAPAQPVSVTLATALVGPGVTTSGTVTLNQPAPAGGAVVALSLSNGKIAKLASSSVTIAAGQSSASFSIQGNSVGAEASTIVTASLNGGSATTTLTVAPGDSLKITSATYSKSLGLLTVTATGTNALATLSVQNANTNAIMGTMVNLGGGSYSFQLALSSGVPSSVSVLSTLGGKTGQGITTIK